MYFASALQALKLKNVGPDSPGFLDGENLEVLLVHDFELIASFLQDLDGKMPHLKTVRFFATNHSDADKFEDFVHDSQYTPIMDFFAKTALHESTTADDSHREFLPRQPPEFAQSPKKAHLRQHPKPGFTAKELLSLADLCPNIEKLGFDIHVLTVKQARSGSLKALAAFPKLRHLRLFFHPDYPVAAAHPLAPNANI
ncbi:MAG: hypothetical protein Q9218_004841 [Villophora microphyllina]